MGGRNHHLDARSVKPLIHLPGECRHLLAKHRNIRGGRPIVGGCPRRILLVLQFLKKTLPRCHVISLCCDETGEAG
ncbi:hypothetical protein [Klebsiella quasipneumoniae]|uniref:hypothetical protein n=1 Tax=Klebsiella quasipneumoniae TaxID=1463165 RepID=UPI0015A74FC3|nr:hypothetical protein [Klebsiella quasipneumoniae]